MDAARVFPDEYVPNVQGSSYHPKWVKANPAEAAKWATFRDACIAYKKGDSLAVPSMATKYGKALVAAGKEHMSVLDLGADYGGPPPPPPPPPDPTWTGPITINAGGTYTGAWESSGSTPPITIITTAPVVLRGYARNLAGATLIKCPDGLAVQLTVDHLTGYGGSTYSTSGRFLEARDFKSITVTNCMLESLRGIDLVYGVAASSIVIQRNRCKNIQGNGKTPVGNFVQLRVVQNASIDVSWNEIVNEYNLSDPEDIISIYYTRNAHVYDNMLWHQSKPGNAQNTSSQGGITLDESEGPSPLGGCNNNIVERNQVIDGYGIVAYTTNGGANNILRDNRIVADQYLPNGQVKGNGYGTALGILVGGQQNRAYGNTVGYVDYTQTRTDFNAASLAGSSVGGTAEEQNNTHLASYPGPVTNAQEQAEWTSWLQKLSSNNITLGP